MKGKIYIAEEYHGMKADIMDIAKARVLIKYMERLILAISGMEIARKML